MLLTRHFIASCAFTCFATVAGTAADWTRFRGPNGTGIVDGVVPTEFTLTENLAWKAKLPGVGHGSPIVLGDKLILQTSAADATTRTILCLSTQDGKELWAHTTAGKPAHMHKKNNFGSPTPCSDGERIYATEWDGTQVNLTALDLNGKELWKKPLGEFANEHGFGHSPMVHDGTVYFNFDQQGEAALLAFDAKTGERKWIAKRQGYRACYTVPMVLERKGKPAEIIVGSTTTVDGYDPKSGKPNWTYTVQWEKGGKPLRAIGQPMISDGHIVVCFGEGGSGRYMVAVKADGTGDVTATGKVWDLKKGTPYVPGAIVYQDHLYWVTDDGIGTCAVANTGEIKWTERVLPKGASSSLLLVGDTLLILGEDGASAAFPARPTWAGEVKKSTVAEPVFATPAAANGKLYIRGRDHLFCIQRKGS
jgi:outer membrane protein assembly factor BamB